MPQVHGDGLRRAASRAGRAADELHRPVGAEAKAIRWRWTTALDPLNPANGYRGAKGTSYAAAFVDATALRSARAWQRIDALARDLIERRLEPGSASRRPARLPPPPIAGWRRTRPSSMSGARMPTCAASTCRSIRRTASSALCGAAIRSHRTTAPWASPASARRRAGCPHGPASRRMQRSRRPRPPWCSRR